MPIVIEEVTGEVLPEPRRESPEERLAEGGVDASVVERAVRAALLREQRRAYRLSDR
jgi:hypothetical protein